MDIPKKIVTIFWRRPAFIPVGIASRHLATVSPAKRRRMAERGGFEPLSQNSLPLDVKAVKNNTSPDGTVKGTHIEGIECPILAKVVSRWDELSEDTKRAIGAIVDMS